jgi:hypothetical protein
MTFYIHHVSGAKENSRSDIGPPRLCAESVQIQSTDHGKSLQPQSCNCVELQLPTTDVCRIVLLFSQEYQFFVWI